MKCPKCGTEIKQEYNYCPNCKMLLNKKSKLKIKLHELLFILLLIGSLIPFIWLLIEIIQNYNTGVQKEFLCLDACEPTILYGKDAVFHTLITFSVLLSPVFIGSIILIIVSVKNLKKYKNSFKHFLLVILVIFLFFATCILISLLGSHKLKTNKILKTTDFDNVIISYKDKKIIESKEVIKYYIEGHDNIYFFMNKGKYIIKIYNPHKEYSLSSPSIRGNNFEKINKINSKVIGNYKIDEVKTENVLYKYEYVYGSGENSALIEDISYTDNSGLYSIYEVELKEDALLCNPINLSNMALTLANDGDMLYDVVEIAETQKVEIEKVY